MLGSAVRGCSGGCCKGRRSTVSACVPRLQIKGMEDVVQQGQSYSATLQSYNTALQTDLSQERTRREEAGAARDTLQAQVSELSGKVKALEGRLEFEQVRAAPGTEGKRRGC